jgi:GPH family glycoside/pentoside/hexuronide:cation symporter
VRGATVAYFFLDIIGPDVSLSFFGIMFLFYSGLFLGIGEVSNMAGVALCVPIANKLGKKSTFILVNAALVVFSVVFFFVPCTPNGFWVMLILQVVISIFTGIMSPLIWSMYADVSDYAELKYHTASTGLIFSSASMAQKFGGAIGGAAVLWLLSGFGYETDAAALAAGATQPESALMVLRWLMSFIPAAVAAFAIIVVWFYPLTTKRVQAINDELRKYRDIE